MWQGLDLIPHAPTFVEGDKYHPEAIRELKELGRTYADAELGGVLLITPAFYDENVFPVNSADPLQERNDWDGFMGLAAVESRNWDGLPFLADAVQRAARTHGVPTGQRPGPIDHAVWAPMRHMFPRHTAMPVLPVGLSGLGPRSHYRFGLAVRDAVIEAPKPIAVMVSANLTHRPDLLRWDATELIPEGRAVDRELIAALERGDWSRFDGLDPALLSQARPEGGRNLWSLIRGLAGSLKGELKYYGPALGAYGMAVVHFEPEAREAA